VEYSNNKYWPELVSKYGNKIESTCKLTSEYKFWVGGQEIGVKIAVDLHGKYLYELSHQYKGPDMETPYGSSINGNFDDEGQALEGALREMLTFYRADEGGTWVKNDSY